MKRVRRLILFILAAGLSLPVVAQPYTNQNVKLTDQLHSLSINAPPELVYIQTSKDIYETGEDLWFKVYLLDAQYLIPSVLSRTLYLQVVNEKNKEVVWQEKYEIQNGFANGRISIERSLAEGYYLLEAYTSNSFFDDSAEFKAIRRVLIKTDISTRTSLTTRFDKASYNGKDSIRIRFSPLSEPWDSSEAEITATLYRGNKKLNKVQAVINGNGQKVLSFPPNDAREGLRVTVITKYKDRTETSTLTVPYEDPRIQFTTFPEGGNLVAGIQNKLAFKGVAGNGDPVETEGTLYEDNIPLLKFKSLHAGMGSFNFTPCTGKKYFIRLLTPKTDSLFQLPEIYPSGIIMSLFKRDKDVLAFKISQSSDLKLGDGYIRVQCRGVVCGIAAVKLKKELIVKIPLSELPQGITEVTLFNSSLMPVAERLVYINQEKKLNISVSLLKNIYPTRGNAIMKITVRDEKGHPVTANLGVTVFDKLYQNPADSDNILVHTYLSTQIRGNIYNPSFYFYSTSKQREEAMDLLMLTQGWRRYIWSESNLNIFANRHKQTITDGIKGEVFIESVWKMIRKEQKFVLGYSPFKGKGNIFIPVDTNGCFTIIPDYLKACEGDYVYMKPLAPMGVKPLIRLSDPFDTIKLMMRDKEIFYPHADAVTPDKIVPATQVVRAGVVSIKEVTIRGKRPRMVRDKYFGRLDSMLNPDYVCIYNVLNCPNHVREPGYTYPVEGSTYKLYVGSQTTEIVYDSTFKHSSLYQSSRINYGYTEEKLLKMYNLSRVKAYYGPREFYQPNYDQATENVLIPDYRNTLLWEPSVITDEKGEATLSFFCSDINSGFIGRIEGVSDSGLLGYGSFKFSVRKLKLIP